MDLISTQVPLSQPTPWPMPPRYAAVFAPQWTSAFCESVSERGMDRSVPTDQEGTLSLLPRALVSYSSTP